MTWLMVVFVFIMLLGVFGLSYQVYRLTVLDAQCRGLKHPKFWGIFSISGNSGSGGLLLYLIGRRKYPSTMTEAEQCELASRKRKAGVCLIFATIGAILMIMSIASMPFEL